jgi:flagellar basal-body rod protein FlgG
LPSAADFTGRKITIFRENIKVIYAACRLLLLMPGRQGCLQRERFLASGIWTAAAGAAAQAQSVDVVANNLANVDTLAFKKDLPTFKEYLTTVEREHQPEEIPRGPIKDKEFYPLDGRDQAFVVVDGTYTNFKQGNLRVTHSPLDVALDGPGFFEVNTPSGIRYTRQGSLKMAMDGRLVTTEGYPVLATQPGGLANALPASAVQPSQGGLPTQGGVAVGQNVESVAQRYINLSDYGSRVSIGASGEIYAGEDLVGRLSVVEFKDTSKLRKTGGALFENRDSVNAATQSKQTMVRQGVLETSNVNPVEEMTNMIKANRLFEHDMKALKTYGELLGREAVDIGKL